MRKRQRCRRVPCVIPALALVFVMLFSMIPSIQASAAGDDMFYMTVSGTMRYDYANEVANLTNQQRMANGQAPLQMDSELTERAMLRAREITRIFSHTRPNGESYASVLDGSRFEYAASGENIAKGWPAQYFTPSVVITGWMNSDGHRANILRSNYQSIGVGVAVDASTGNACYVQIFSSLPADGQGVYNGIAEYSNCVEGNLNNPENSMIEGYPDAYYVAPIFDANYYMNTYPDIYSACGGYDKGNAFVHFLICGMSEGRRGSEEFDVYSYKNQYYDLRTAFGDDLPSYYNHYLVYGKAEGRQGAGFVGINNPNITSLDGVTDYAPVYNFDYYVSAYPDVQSLYWDDPLGALRHFVEYGMAEGRQASENFNVYSYKNQYVDLRRAFGNDLKSYYQHFVEHGKDEGRIGTGCEGWVMNPVTSLDGRTDYGAVYNYDYYISHNSDVAAAYGMDDISVLRHFIEYGMKEGRQGSENFNVDSYKNQYPDLRAAYGNDLVAYYQHFVEYGYEEGRAGTGSENTLVGRVTRYQGKEYGPVYDFYYYVEHNPDVAAAFGNDDIAVLEHFVNCGMREGRQGSASFNVNVYRDRNGDLQQAFGDDLRSYYIHYLDNGLGEGRTGI